MNLRLGEEARSEVVANGSLHAWHVEVNRILRTIRMQALYAHERLEARDVVTASRIAVHLKEEFAKLKAEWEGAYKAYPIDDLLGPCLLAIPSRDALVERSRLAWRQKRRDRDNKDAFLDIVTTTIPRVEQRLHDGVLQAMKKPGDRGWDRLLHSVVRDAAYQQWKSGLLRDAVLNAFIAVLDFMRKRTGLTLDGDALITKALSEKDPLLVLSELDTDSGRNDQVGFMQIFQGAHRGVRNPKAHTLLHDLNAEKAARYLIFASLLAARVEEARKVDELATAPSAPSAEGEVGG